MADLRDLLERGVRGFDPSGEDGLTRTLRKVDRRRRRRQIVAGAVALALAAGTLGGLAAALLGDGERIEPARPPISDVVPLGGAATAMASGFDSLWVTAVSNEEPTLFKIDPRTGQIVARIQIEGDPVGVATGAGSVWVSAVGTGILRLDPETGATEDEIILRPGDSGVGSFALVPGVIAVTDENVRLAHRGGGGVTVRIDAMNPDLIHLPEHLFPGPVRFMETVGDSVWAAGGEKVARFDGSSDEPDFGTERDVGPVMGLAASGDYVWVAWGDGMLERLATPTPFAPSIGVGLNDEPAIGMETVGDDLWVVTSGGVENGANLWRLDAASGEVRGGPAPIGISAAPKESGVADRLIAAGGSLWFADHEAGSLVRLDTSGDVPEPVATPSPALGDTCPAPELLARYVPPGVSPVEPQPGLGGGADPDLTFTNAVHYGDSPGPDGLPAAFINVTRTDENGGPIFPADHAREVGEPIEVLGGEGYLVSVEDGWGVFFLHGQGPCNGYEITAYGPTKAETRRFAEGLRAP